MDYESIFFEYEEQYKDLNNQKLKEFVELFLGQTKIDIEEVKLIYMVKENDYDDLSRSLKDYVFKFYPQYISLYYQLLEESHYKMFYDILDSMFILGVSTNKRLNREKSELLLNSPYIENISYNNGMVVLNSCFGKYSFCSLRDYFRGSYSKMAYVRNNNNMPGDCHNVSWDLLQILDNASLVTQLLPFYYRGTFYHSVVQDEDGMFIDLANEAVYDEEVRKNLYQGQIICKTKKEDLESHLYDTITASNNPYIEEEFNKALLLALHKQSVDMKKNLVK